VGIEEGKEGKIKRLLVTVAWLTFSRDTMSLPNLYRLQPESKQLLDSAFVVLGI
jgi:hypothetical protein